MHLSESHLILTATDLSNFLGCPHLSLLDRAVTRGAPKPPKFDDPSLEVLRQRGLEHERAFRERLEGEGKRVVEIADEAEGTPAQRWRHLAAQTFRAMQGGADVVYQGVLFDGTWLGKPDFLLKVPGKSLLGGWSYEVADTKLAREAKGGALLQVLLYSELLAGVQGVRPEHTRIELGGGDDPSARFRVADYGAYFRSVRGRFVAHLASEGSLEVAPDPVAHCDVCAWRTRCDGERRAVDHLSLVAGITRRQRDALRERGVSTMAALGRLPLPVQPPLEGVSRVSLERVREQARVQVEGRESGSRVHELLTPVVAEQGLAMLPAPSPGDLFFDFEGDPFALDGGLEYLFGFTDADGAYTGWWALDRAQEKAALERFVDLVIGRLERWPDLHVYHFGAYEPATLKRLMGRHATREDEVDRLLRAEVFVDLHRAVKNGLRASVESYSIKKLEPFYGFERATDLRQAGRALADFEAWLELGRRGESDDVLLREIEAYNRDDCVSTFRLREWLEGLREELAGTTGEPVPRPTPPGDERSEAAEEEQAEVAALVASLTGDVPADPAERTEDQQGRWLLAQMLGWHRREKKSMWWEYFRCTALSDEELVEDRATLGGLEYERVVDTVKRSEIHRYRFPRQDHPIREGDKPHDPATQAPVGEVWALDEAAGTVDLKRGRTSQVPHPRGLVPLDDVQDGVLRQSIRRLAAEVVTRGLTAENPHGAAVDLLLARPPRAGQGAGERLFRTGESTLDAARRLVPLLDRTVLPIQGPPGAGKTYTGARMIVTALRAGKRVGVTATSHKVISNLLDEVCKAAAKEELVITGIQKAKEEQWCGRGEIVATNENDEVRDALASGQATLAAGTAWLWSREDMAGSVDLLFVDEAGQFSLANALAVSPAASSLVLLGDPRQLEQPQQGVHPPGADASALEHLLRGEPTIASERGLFLESTWRLHPDICAFTSEIFYRGRLAARGELARQTVRGPRVRGSGLRLIPVPHAGNQSESPEEVEAVAALFEELLEGGYAWVDKEGHEKEIGVADILVVAPYNAQVAALAARLPAGARVGTVDRFQGQEAPIVVYSMATSSAEEAPRGMDFLYNPNRLNVATSRARCMAIVVASPALFTPACRAPGQMRLANAFCRFAELAGGVGSTHKGSQRHRDGIPVHLSGVRHETTLSW